MTQSTEKERAEFEAWAAKNYHGINLEHEGRSYRYFLANEWWTAWQAARRAQVVPVPQSIEQMAVDRYKVVPSHSSMFYPCAVVAGDGQQQLYVGREVECQNMARKFTGAFLDGAFVALAAAPQPPEAGLKRENPTSNPEAAPVQMPEPEAWRYTTAQKRSYAYRGAKKDFDKEYPILKPEPLYTEHQVRQLLADHGVK